MMHVVMVFTGCVKETITVLYNSFAQRRATYACLTADPGVASSISAWSHTFVEKDHEIISMVIPLPST